MNHLTFARQLVRESHPDWEVPSESTLICPHGHTIEWDGECPEGCISPIRELGFI